MIGVKTAIGLMSGTSMDGIDVALVRTDGDKSLERLGADFMPYPDNVRDQIRACLGHTTDPDGRIAETERVITDWHIDAVTTFMKTCIEDVDLIGFHGQTIFHDPAKAATWQIGDGQRLAIETGIDVMFDFRTADMKAGGQGAPLLPLYHRALIHAANLAMPACILNLGGVGNLTWVNDKVIMACDTGPGNALLDDWIHKKTGLAMDRDGAIAMKGAADMTRVRDWMQHPYFAVKPPKSLDRNEFAHCSVDDLSLEDGAATLAAFTVAGAIAALKHMPAKPGRIIVAGGGRRNAAIMQGLAKHMQVINANDLGWSGDAMEAEGFAYLAVRSVAGLPLTLPTTTGCKLPTTGGRFVRARG